jgi:hypothetical protein
METVIKEIIIAVIGASATIGAACINAVIAALAAVVVAIITNRLVRAEKSVVEAKNSIVDAEKSINQISEGLPSLKLLFENDANGNCI